MESSMPYQVLARKYRPKQFHEVIGQPCVVQALSNALTNQFLHHAYLFTGTRGVGKTTLARILAKCLNCEKGISPNPCGQCGTCQEIDGGRFPDFYEVDAASRTKVEDTRELLDNVQYAPSKGRYKIYLIDEVHMLSGHSFNALLITLEEPPPHVKFFLATTDPQKLPATILSRCLQFHLSQMTPEQTTAHLMRVLQQENISFDEPALNLIGKAAQGSMRDALSLLDQCIAYGNGKVLLPEVKTMLGTVEPTALFDILDALSQRNGENILCAINHLYEQGIDFQQALAELLSLLHRISVMQVIPSTPIDTEWSPLTPLAEKIQPEDIQLFYQIGLLGQRDFPYAPNPKIAFEMTILRMLAFYPGNTGGGVTTTSTQKTPTKNETSTAISQSATEWHAILPQLKVTGAALALAQNCSLQKITESQAFFVVKPNQQPLVQPKQVQRLSDALTQYWQRPMTAIIKIEDQNNPTPAELTVKNQQERRHAAKEALIADPKLQQLLQTFDATLIEESITTDNKTT